MNTRSKLSIAKGLLVVLLAGSYYGLTREFAARTATAQEEGPASIAPGQLLALVADPASLAVAGVSSAGFASGAAAVESMNSAVAATEAADGLAAAEQACADARSAAWRGGSASSRASQLEAFAAARLAAQCAFDAAAESCRDAFLAVAAPELSPSDRLMLERSVQNRLRRVPERFRVLELAEPQWRVLEEAWRKSRLTATLSQAEAQALAAAEADPAVFLAASRLHANLAEVQQAFEQALPQGAAP